MAPSGRAALRGAFACAAGLSLAAAGCAPRPAAVDRADPGEAAISVASGPALEGGGSSTPAGALADAARRLSDAPAGEADPDSGPREPVTAAAAPAADAGPAGDADAAPCSHVPSVCCVALQPLGRVPQEDIDAAAGALRELYGFEVRVLAPVDLPRSAWYEPRRRWRAEQLNDFLRPLLPDGCDRIAGLTTQDISTTKGDIADWGILGLADLSGTAAVFSTYRCRRRVHDVPALERLRRVAVHEVGHTLGLPHCPTYGCFMEDAGGKAETIDRETFLCDVCRVRLGWIE